MPSRIKGRQSQFVKWSDIPKRTEYDEDELQAPPLDHTPSERFFGGLVDIDNEEPHGLNEKEIAAWLDKTFTVLFPICSTIPPCYQLLDGTDSPEICVFTDTVPPDADLAGRKITVMGDIAPHYWVPTDIEQHLNAETYWELQKTTPPVPDTIDYDAMIPWWKTYPAARAFWLEPQIHLEDTGVRCEVEPAETYQDRLKRDRDHGSQQKAEDFVKKRRQREQDRKAAKARIMEQHNRDWSQPIAKAYPSLNPNSPDAVSGAVMAVDSGWVATNDLWAAQSGWHWNNHNPPDTSINPNIDFVIRSACDFDAEQLRAIYNFYVTSADHCVAIDTEPMSKNCMLTRIQSIQRETFPFLVAVATGNKKPTSPSSGSNKPVQPAWGALPNGKQPTNGHVNGHVNGHQNGSGRGGRGRGHGRGGRGNTRGGRGGHNGHGPINGTTHAGPSRQPVPTHNLTMPLQRPHPLLAREGPPKYGDILGMIWADDRAGPKTILQYTAEVEIYVHPAYTRKAIGTSLLDCLLSQVDPFHTRRQGYTTKPDLEPGAVGGGRRRVKTLMLDLPYWKGEPETWKEEWLAKAGFKAGTMLEDAGVKGDLALDIVPFSRGTGEKVVSGFGRMRW